MINVMIVFSIIAVVDKIFGNRLGLGKKFDKGFKTIGNLALTIIGIYSISPILAKVLVPILYPLGDILNVEPSVFIASILAPDLGGYNTVMEIAISDEIGKLNGLVLSSMLGATVSFTIPLAVGLISKEDFNYFAKGVLAGIITIPFGVVIGGLMMKISLKLILLNLIPVIFFSFIIILGLMKVPEKVIKIFNVLGKIIIIISTVGLILNIINFIFGIELVSNLVSLEESAILVMKIGIILSGAYPMFYLLATKFNTYLLKMGKRFGLDEYSILGIISSLANCIPMFGIYDKMNDKGKILNAAFVVSGAYTFGGQLGYISSVSTEAINPFIISKLVAGILAIMVASATIKLEKIEGGLYDNQ